MEKMNVTFELHPNSWILIFGVWERTDWISLLHHG